ncbi:hypothetical protein ACFL9U_03715 [Thermodesulfobacteriota bacterium]
MKKSLKQTLRAILAFTFILTIAGIAIADPVTVVGTVADDGMLQGTDDVNYQVGDTEKGFEVLDKVGQKVAVTGDITEDADGKIIYIRSYTILEE